MKNFLILSCMVGISFAVIDIDVDNEKKKLGLLFLTKVRNYMTHDNKVNDDYIRQVNKECWNTTDTIIEENIKECTVEQETPIKTALFLYDCIVKTVKEDHIEENAAKKKKAGLCQLTLINFIKDGKINKEVVKQKMLAEGETEAVAEKVVQACSEDKDTPEATADFFIVCLADQYKLTD